MTIRMTLILLLTAAVATTLDATPVTITLSPVIEDVFFGQLVNAPNGHISFARDDHGFRIWLPGRDPGPDQEGGFLLEVPGWSGTELQNATATFGLGPSAPGHCPDGDNDFDRNYGAINAVVPGSNPHTLLAFYDAEFHPVCQGDNPQPEPLLSSIGLAISADDGVTWTKQGQIIQGLDQAKLGFECVTDWQIAGGTAKEDDGASGPSVVVREDDGVRYLYLYYADRATLHGTYADDRKDSLYVARAMLATNGMPGSWQQWNGTGWGAVGDETVAAPIVVPPPGDGVALQPHTSYNTALHRWLMVFKTKVDFSITTSIDGVQWTTPVSLLAPTSYAEFGFPTLVSVDLDDCHGGPCEDRDEALGHHLSQQITRASGYLYYSARTSDPPSTHYLGHRVRFDISGFGNSDR
jgi:hypothetical protein